MLCLAYSGVMVTEILPINNTHSLSLLCLQRSYRPTFIRNGRQTGDNGAEVHAVFEFVFESGGSCPVGVWVCDLCCQRCVICAVRDACRTIWHHLCQRERERAFALPQGSKGVVRASPNACACEKCMDFNIGQDVTLIRNIQDILVGEH